MKEFSENGKTCHSELRIRQNPDATWSWELEADGRLVAVSPTSYATVRQLSKCLCDVQAAFAAI